jgi:N-methylhydantoinase B
MPTGNAPTLLDPITFEVLRNGFRAMCTEASALVERVSFSPTITEGHDNSISILTGDGRLISHGHRDQGPHMGTFEACVQTLLDEVDEFIPGDVFIFNDPYTGGTHQNDVSLMRPIFVDGEVFAFGIALSHWPDMGGPMPGTFNPIATECYAEGLRLPCMKVFETDEPVRSVLNLIRANTRIPDELFGNLHGQFEGVRLLERRVLEYVAKFGSEVVGMAFEQVMNHSETLLRDSIRRLPDGVYEFEDYGDKDIMHPEKPRIRVSCRLVIEGDQATLDFTDSDDAPIGSWGFARPALLSAAYDGTMHCFPELTPLSNGITRWLQIKTRPGSCVDVQEPTPITGYCSGAYEKVDFATMACWGQALVDIDRSRIHAGTTNLANVVTGGIHPKTNRPFVSYLWLEGGQGANPERDGPSFLNMVYIAGASNQSIEVLERWYPMRYTSCEGVVDSCGHGRFRGGLAMSRDFDVWGRTTITVHGDREEIGPPGLAGGQNGGPNLLIKNRGRPDEENLGMFAAGRVLEPGDHITFHSNGGGGLGNPLDRDPELVLADVVDGYISLDAARDVYGVVINVVDQDALDWRIDTRETLQLRAALLSREPVRGFGPWEVNPLGEKIQVFD